MSKQRKITFSVELTFNTEDGEVTEHASFATVAEARAWILRHAKITKVTEQEVANDR